MTNCSIYRDPVKKAIRDDRNERIKKAIKGGKFEKLNHYSRYFGCGFAVVKELAEEVMREGNA